MVQDRDTVDEAAQVQMGEDEFLTAYLGECLCVPGVVGPGELCGRCGGHVGCVDCNGVCLECDTATGQLLNCFACNLSFHRGCMPSIGWGLTGPNPNRKPYRTLTLTLDLHL